MKFVTIEEVEKWCNARGLRVGSDRLLYYDDESRYGFSIGLDDKPSRVIAMADYLVPTWEDVPFEGALLWIRERGIWGDFSENTGAMIVRQMRMGKGEAAPLEEKPGQLFAADELFEMHSYLVIPMLFGWDAS